MSSPTDPGFGRCTPPSGAAGAGGPASRRLGALSLVAAVLGGFVGLVAWLLFRLIALITNLCFAGTWSWRHAVPVTHQLPAWVILVPAAGGLAAGLMARFGSWQICGHGIDAVIEAVLFRGSRVAPRIAVLKPVSSAVVIGTGGPFGVEGPIIQTGGAVGSIAGQLLHLTAAERKTLLGAGAAAGLAATFNTPVAAVMLAIELILFEYKPRSFIPVVVATAIATTVRLLILGRGPLVLIHAPDFGYPRELPWYLLLGVVSGLAAVGFVRAYEWFEDGFDLLGRLHIDLMWWPALGGLALGVIGWCVPQTLGSGYGTIAGILNEKLPFALVGMILLGKPLALLTALGSRTSGGTLAPMFMTGAALGALFAAAANALVPGLALSSGACALLAMAAFFGAAARAPFALVIFGIEMTHDFQAVLPLMLVVAVAHGIALMLMRHTVMTLSLARQGLPVPQEYEADIFQRVTVGNVMDPRPTALPAGTTVAELASRVAAGEPALLRHSAYPLLDAEGNMCGIVTRGDVQRARAREPGGSTTLLDAGTRDLLVAFPDETVDDALNRMLRRDCGRLPVVSRGNPRVLLGYFGRKAALNARLQRAREEFEREPGWLKRVLRTRPR